MPTRSVGPGSDIAHRGSWKDAAVRICRIGDTKNHLLTRWIWNWYLSNLTEFSATVCLRISFASMAPAVVRAKFPLHLEVPPRKVDKSVLKTDKLRTKSYVKNTFGCVSCVLKLLLSASQSGVVRYRCRVPWSWVSSRFNEFLFLFGWGCFTSTQRANSRYLSVRGTQDPVAWWWLTS